MALRCWYPLVALINILMAGCGDAGRDRVSTVVGPTTVNCQTTTNVDIDVDCSTVTPAPVVVPPVVVPPAVEPPTEPE